MTLSPLKQTASSLRTPARPLSNGANAYTPVRFAGNGFNDALGWFKKTVSDVLDISGDEAPSAKPTDKPAEKPTGKSDSGSADSGWSLDNLLGTVLDQADVVKNKATEVMRGATTPEEKITLWSQDFPNELAEKGQFDKAYQSFQKAMQLDPANAAVQVRLGDFCRKWGKLQLMWKHGIKLEGHSEAVVQGLSQTKLAFLSEAKEAYRQAIKLGCEKPDQVKQFLSRTLQLNHEWKEAIGVLEELHQANPTSSAVLTELAGVYQETNQSDKAIAAYETILKQEKEPTADIPYRLGLIYDLQAEQAGEGDRPALREKALSYYMKAISAEPTDVKTHIQLGDKLKEYNLQTLALGEYQRALDQVKELRRMGDAALKEYGITIDLMDVHKAEDRIERIRAERKKSGSIIPD